MDRRWYVRQHRVLRTAFFWVMTQEVVVISYRRFGTTEMNLGEPKNPDARSERQKNLLDLPAVAPTSAAVSHVAYRPY